VKAVAPAHPTPRAPTVRIIPREHGTWAMWLVPWAVGAGFERRVGAGSVLLLIAAFAFFLAHAQLIAWWRVQLSPARDARMGSPAGRVALVLGAVGAVVSTPLLATSSIPWLIGLGVAGAAVTLGSLWLVTVRLDHALAGQVLAAIGLPLIAPAAYVANGGGDAGVIIGLWLLDAAFFLWAVFYVRLKIQARSRRAVGASVAGRTAFLAPTIALDVALGCLACVAIYSAGMPLRVLWALAPAVVQAAAGALRIERPAALKRVGIIMAVHATLFGALVIALAR
jgi:YwiC-like protein